MSLPVLWHYTGLVVGWGLVAIAKGKGVHRLSLAAGGAGDFALQGYTADLERAQILQAALMTSVL